MNILEGLMFKRLLHQIIILVFRPYICRELPGWGRIYRIFVGDYPRDTFWQGHPQVLLRGKIHGYQMRLDLSKWADRSAFFLGRWYDLSAQLFLRDALGAGDVVVDVGANRGMFSLCASRLVGESGLVIAFEPNPASARIFSRDIVDNRIANVKLIQCALSDTAGIATLHIPDVNSGEASLGGSKYSATTSIDIETQVGDELLRGKNIRLIKIDVEGFEVSVIKGLVRTISANAPIIITEVIEEHLVRCGTSSQALLNLMKHLGYRGYKLGITRINGKWAWKTTAFETSGSDCDVVWIKMDATLPASNARL